MGSTSSRHKGASKSTYKHTEAKTSSEYRFRTIRNEFETLEQVQDALRRLGLEASQMIVGIDFTKSNEWTGKYSFGGKCLHTIGDGYNRSPYDEACSIIARTLRPFDVDNLVPCFGFGDATTQATGVFSFFENGRPAQGLEELVARYSQIAASVNLAGPTSFAPLIYHALQLVQQSGMQFHVLVIIADGQVTPTEKQATIKAIEMASQYPLAIVMVGVGDGPWEEMQRFDDELPQRRFDNFQFVNFTDIKEQARRKGWSSERCEAEFALWALMEVPEQYNAAMKLRLTTPGTSPPPPYQVRVLPPPVPEAAAPAASAPPFSSFHALPPGGPTPPPPNWAVNP